MKSARVVPCCALAVFFLVGCMTPIAPDTESGDGIAAQRTYPNKRGKKHESDSTPPAPTPQWAWYRLALADEFDPLSRFGLDGQQVLLQTDSTITSWGTDYWGYWDEPFMMEDNVLSYTVGLSHTTYTFLPLAGEGFDVTRTIVVQPYLVGEPTTTVTHVGVFEPEG
jgi:hypothetical protein